MKKQYSLILGLFGIFFQAHAMLPLPKELSGPMVKTYLSNLQKSVEHQDYKTIMDQYNELYSKIFRFEPSHGSRVQEILGHAAQIIYPFANQVAQSELNRDQKLDILSSMAFIFVGTAYHELIQQEIQKLLAQPAVRPAVEPEKKFTPLASLERKTKAAIAEQDLAELKQILQQAKQANAFTIQQEAQSAIASITEQQEREQEEFIAPEPQKGLETYDDEYIAYIQETVLQAKWSGEKFDELRDILLNLKKDHPYYEAVKKTVEKIKAKRAQ